MIIRFSGEDEEQAEENFILPGINRSGSQRRRGRRFRIEDKNLREINKQNNFFFTKKNFLVCFIWLQIVFYYFCWVSLSFFQREFSKSKATSGLVDFRKSAHFSDCWTWSRIITGRVCHFGWIRFVQTNGIVVVLRIFKWIIKNTLKHFLVAFTFGSLCFWGDNRRMHQAMLFEIWGS